MHCFYSLLKRSVIWMVTKDGIIAYKEIKGELQGQDTSVADQIIHCYLSQGGLNGRWRRRTPLLKAKLKKVRQEFAQMNIDKSQSFWDNGLCIEEAKLEFFGKSHQHYMSWICAKIKFHHCQGFLEQNVLPSFRKFCLSRRSWSSNRIMVPNTELKTPKSGLE